MLFDSSWCLQVPDSFTEFPHFRCLWSLQGVAVGTVAAASPEETWTFCRAVPCSTCCFGEAEASV